VHHSKSENTSESLSHGAVSMSPYHQIWGGKDEGELISYWNKAILI